MGWIGQTDLDYAGFDRAGLTRGSIGFGLEDPNAILPVGSMVIEAHLTARPGVSQSVLRYQRHDGWTRKLRVELHQDGTVSVFQRQGLARFEVSLTMVRPAVETFLRITFSWDAPKRTALLTVENPGQDLIYQAEAASPLPMPLADIREIVLNGPAARIGPDVRFVAFSDKIEPVGLPLGVVEGTPVETPNGPRPVQHLRPGDLVVTLAGGARPVRWLAWRDVPALGRFRPVRLRAPYFGLTRDVFCAPDHRVVVTGAEAEYQLGEPAVLVEAAHLVDGRFVCRERPDAPVLRYFHVLLDRHECLNHCGAWTESLFVGAIGQARNVLKTTVLAPLPYAAIPRHRHLALPALGEMQARALAHSMSA